MVPWLEYINNILTPEILVVDDTERVILDEPGYMRNLTEILKRTPKRTIANYMFFRAASSSLGFFTEAARKVQEDYSKELTGTTSTVGWRTSIWFLLWTNISDAALETVCWYCQRDFLLCYRPPLCEEALQRGGKASHGRDGERHPSWDGRDPEKHPVDGRQDSSSRPGETSHNERVHWLPRGAPSSSSFRRSLQGKHFLKVIKDMPFSDPQSQFRTLRFLQWSISRTGSRLASGARRTCGARSGRRSTRPTGSATTSLPSSTPSTLPSRTASSSLRASSKATSSEQIVPRTWTTGLSAG